jgi:hypothetical protein
LAIADGSSHTEEMARMTENYQPVTTPAQRGGSPPPLLAEEPGEVGLKEQASDLGHSGADAGRRVADVAREQASGVTAEARRQGRNLMQQAQEQLQGQATQGQQQLARRLLSFSDELRSMADASGQDGMAGGLAHQAASNMRAAGQWLDNRNPGQVATEIRSFAHRRPAAFFALAAAAGLVAGRLTRGLKDADSEESDRTATTARPQTAQGSSEQQMLAPDAASPSSPVPGGTGDETGGSGLPLAGDAPVWEQDPPYGESSRLVPGQPSQHEDIP